MMMPLPPDDASRKIQKIKTSNTGDRINSNARTTRKLQLPEQLNFIVIPPRVATMSYYDGFEEREGKWVNFFLGLFQNLD